MGIELDKLGWPYNRLRSPDHLGWLYRNANKPRPPTRPLRMALCAMGLVALMQLGGYLPWWVWGASAPWRMLGLWTATIAAGALWLWASRRGFFYLVDHISD